MTRGCLFGNLLLCAASMLPAVQAQSQPVRVAPFRGQYCTSFAPQGWFVVAENPTRSGFGADFASPDSRAAASFSIFPAGAINPVPGSQTPEGAVAVNLSRMNSIRLQYGERKQVAPNVFQVAYRGAQYQGIAFYQVFPTSRGSYMVVMRTAYTSPADWSSRAAEASAVARSAHCQVPNVPAAPDPPGLNPKTGRHSSGDVTESDSLYNPWLDKEYYHNAATGENFWVSPSQDYRQNGPDGPGYYAQHGNAVVKLQSGYAQ